jgi:hypothetical protein
MRTNRPRDYEQVVESIFTDFTSSVGFALVEAALVGLGASFEVAIPVVLVASCHGVPVTSTLCPTCASRLSPFSPYDVAATGAVVSRGGVAVVPVADGVVTGGGGGFAGGLERARGQFHVEATDSGKRGSCTVVRPSARALYNSVQRRSGQPYMVGTLIGRSWPGSPRRAAGSRRSAIPTEIPSPRVPCTGRRRASARRRLRCARAIRLPARCP